MKILVLSFNDATFDGNQECFCGCDWQGCDCDYNCGNDDDCTSDTDTD